MLTVSQPPKISILSAPQIIVASIGQRNKKIVLEKPKISIKDQESATKDSDNPFKDLTELRNINPTL